MEPLQIKYFMAVAQSQHIAQTAKQLNVSQPAISLSISRLEQELGVKLFNRIGRNIVLNEYGAAFYEHANKILREEMKEGADPERLAEELVRECKSGLGIRVVPDVKKLGELPRSEKKTQRVIDNRY